MLQTRRLAHGLTLSAGRITHTSILGILRGFCSPKVEYEDLYDAHLALNLGRKFHCEYSDSSVSLLAETEVLGTVLWKDVFLVNLRSTDWGPQANDLYYDIYDRNCGMMVEDSPVYFPLSIPSGIDLSAGIVRQLTTRGLKLNADEFDKGVFSTVHASFTLHFNEARCREAVAAVADGTANNAGDSILEERARRAHYLYRSLFMGHSNLYPGMQASPRFDPSSLLPTE